MNDTSQDGTDVPDDDDKSADESEPPSPADSPTAALRELVTSIRESSWLAGIATGLISGVLVAFYLSATGQATVTAIRHGFARPSCSNPQWLLQVPDTQIFSSAFYEQKDAIPGFADFHVASNSIDGDLSSSWLQFWPSKSDHQGDSSDYIEWSFAQPYDVRLICVVDGWTEDLTTYMDTLPIGTAKVYSTDGQPPAHGSPLPSSGCATEQARFKDYLQKSGEVEFTYQWQPVSFHCNTSNIVLHIASVSRTSSAWRGKSLVDSELNGYQDPLVGLSEVKFYYCPTALCGLPTN